MKKYMLAVFVLYTYLFFVYDHHRLIGVIGIWSKKFGRFDDIAVRSIEQWRRCFAHFGGYTRFVVNDISGSTRNGVNIADTSGATPRSRSVYRMKKWTSREPLFINKVKSKNKYFNKRAPEYYKKVTKEEKDGIKWASFDKRTYSEVFFFFCRSFNKTGVYFDLALVCANTERIFL